MRAVILLDRKRLKNGWLRRVQVNGLSPRVGEDCVVILSDAVWLPGRISQVYFAGGLFFDVALTPSPSPTGRGENAAPSAPLRQMPAALPLPPSGLPSGVLREGKVEQYSF